MGKKCISDLGLIFQIKGYLESILGFVCENNCVLEAEFILSKSLNI